MDRELLDFDKKKKKIACLGAEFLDCVLEFLNLNGGFSDGDKEFSDLNREFLDSDMEFSDWDIEFKELDKIVILGQRICIFGLKII